MKTADERVIKRFAELVYLGRQVLATRRAPAPGHFTSDFVNVELANRWMVSSLNIIERVLGPNSPHARRFEDLVTEYPKWPDTSQAFGVLLSAEDDVRSGALFEVRRLVEAELFDEFLEQAEYLLGAGYFQPAAVIAGSVLEDSLRKLCQRQSIDIPEKPKLDSMNSALAKAGVYTKLTQKKVTAMADVRNSAAHGKWNDFDKADAREMIVGVRQFMEKHFA